MPADAAAPVFSRRTIFLVATGFGVSSTLQATFLDGLGKGGTWTGWSHSALLNFWYWYVPALLAPVILAVARRFALDKTPVWQQVAVHGSGILLYSATHTAAMVLFRAGLGRISAHRWMAEDLWRFSTQEFVRQFDWLMMTYLFLVGLAHAVNYRRLSERHALDSAQLETRLVEARLQALQRQLHPHFLFNTLNTIAALVTTQPAAADRMIEQLGALLRETLRVGDRPVVPLETELETLRTYLNIEQTRLGARLHVELRVAEDALTAEVPSLFLQPLVENAIRHGVAPHGRDGWVRVEAAQAGDRLRVSVSDSGHGTDEGTVAKATSGVGLANTRARLEHLYPGDHRLALEVTGDGFRVSVDMPFRPARSGARAVVA